MIIGCSTEPEDILGCTDLAACNYDEDATEDDGSCTVYDECEICGGNNSGNCIPESKAPLNTKELCESRNGIWICN